MGIEQLNKEELTKMLEEKNIVLELLDERNRQKPADYMTAELITALGNARCRLCVGRVTETMVAIEGDPDGKTRKTTTHTGAPYLESAGGTEMACRTCKHVRLALAGAGIHDVHI